MELLNSAVDSGYIKKGDNLSIDAINDFQPHQVTKKKAVFARHCGMQKNDLKTIATKGLIITKRYDMNDNTYTLNE